MVITYQPKGREQIVESTGLEVLGRNYGRESEVAIRRFRQFGQLIAKQRISYFTHTHSTNLS
jgi:hypothetical protein